MIWLRKVAACAAAAGMAAAPVSGWADYKDRVMNPEGRWGVDVGEGACAASMDLADGGVFMLRVVDGHVTFAVFFPNPVPPGKTGRVRTEAYDFEFTPSFTEDKTVLFYNGDLDSREVAALRLARQVRVLVDGREVSNAVFEHTGFSDALDGAIACSQGQKGWWGKGVGGGSQDEAALNTEGYWSMRTADDPGLCVAIATIDDNYGFALAGDDHGGMGFSVTSKTPIQKARKGRVVTDSFTFAFKPQFAPDGRYVYGEANLDGQAQFALRRAKEVRIELDGRELVNMRLEGTGHAQVMADLLACAAGEKGWWGEGAKRE